MSKYKVAYYLRENMREQSKRHSLEVQKSTLNDWIKDMGWKWVKTYYDGASAKDINFEKFQEMITDAKHGLFDGICMVDSDKINRSTKDLISIMDNLLNHGVRFHIYNLQHIDIYSEKGRFLLTNLTTYNEFFRGQLASKIRAGVKQKMKTEWFGQAPYGFTVLSDDIGGRKKNTRLVKNTEEQKVLNVMRKLRENGKSYSEIATSLNKDDIPTRYTRENKKSNWYSSTVRNILNRPEVVLEYNVKSERK